MRPEELIGKKFKRNLYGELIWTDKITNITVDLRIEDLKDTKLNYSTVKEDFEARENHANKYGFKPEIRVKGEKFWYDINEIKIFL